MPKTVSSEERVVRSMPCGVYLAPLTSKAGPHPLRFPRYRGTEIFIDRGRAQSGVTTVQFLEKNSLRLGVRFFCRSIDVSLQKMVFVIQKQFRRRRGGQQLEARALGHPSRVHLIYFPFPGVFASLKHPGYRAVTPSASLASEILKVTER